MQNPHGPVDGDGQDVPYPQFCVGLVRRLTIDPDRAFRRQPGAIGARAHDPGTPKPLVQTLPVAVLGVFYRAPPCRKAASAANGPVDTGIVTRGSATGRRRRSGISIAGAGGP